MGRRFIYQIGVILVIVVAYFGVYRVGFLPWLEKPETPLKVPPVYDVRIGVIVPSTEVSSIKFLMEIAEKDVHNYLDSIERDESFAFTTFITDTDWENDSVSQHLEKVQSLKSMGYNFIIGGFTESQAVGSLSYMNKYDMILFSPTITLNRSINNFKNFFSLMPNVTSQMGNIADTILDYGLKAVIIIEPNEKQEMKNLHFFSEAFQKREGVIIGSLSSNTSLRALEDLANEALNKFSPDKICVLGFKLSEFLKDLRGFPTIANLTWVTYGDDWTGSVENWLEYGSGFKVLSIRPAFTETLRWENLNAEFLSKTGVKLGYLYGNLYDIFWLYCLGFLETEDYHAAKNIAAIPIVSERYLGVTGYCSLNADGDRKSLPYKLCLIGALWIIGNF